jgi:hypothetical protein
MAMNIHVAVFWVLTPCSDVVRYRHFRGLAASIFRVMRMAVRVTLQLTVSQFVSPP